MKKIILSTCIALGIGSIAMAQVPEMKSRSLVIKFTETWCGPCGGWGWDLAEDVIGDLGDKGYYIGAMGSSTPSDMNSNCSSALISNYPVLGYPTFIVNNTDGGYYLSGISALYNSYYATSPTASPAGLHTISGSTLTVTSKTKFWTSADGEYYVSALVVEDKVLATQNGKAGTVEHHYILRGTMSPDLSPFGVMLHSGSIAANTEYDKTFTMTIPESWNKANLSVILVVFKKEGSTRTFVNAMKSTLSTTSVENINKDITSVNLYPNPASAHSHTQLEVSLAQANNLTISVTDISGRLIYSIPSQNYNAGKNTITIPTSQMAAGYYNVNISGEKVNHNSALLVK